MFTFIHLIQSLGKGIAQAFPRSEPARDADEAYLAQASDIYDLERRIRALDDRGRSGDQGICLGLYPR